MKEEMSSLHPSSFRLHPFPAGILSTTIRASKRAARRFDFGAPLAWLCESADGVVAEDFAPRF
jgi:hypothetical protein